MFCNECSSVGRECGEVLCEACAPTVSGYNSIVLPHHLVGFICTFLCNSPGPVGHAEGITREDGRAPVGLRCTSAW